MKTQLFNFDDYNFSEIVKNDDVDYSFGEVQRLLGITDGGVCGIYWSGFDDDVWSNSSIDERLNHIKKYIELENVYINS